MKRKVLCVRCYAQRSGFSRESTGAEPVAQSKGVSADKTVMLESGERIRALAPPGVPLSMVAHYIERCLASFPGAQTALDASDYNFLRTYGHGLKGSGGGYGLPLVSEMGDVIEQAARRGDSADLQNQLAALQFYLNRLEIVPR